MPSIDSIEFEVVDNLLRKREREREENWMRWPTMTDRVSKGEEPDEKKTDKI